MPLLYLDHCLKQPLGIVPKGSKGYQYGYGCDYVFCFVRCSLGSHHAKQKTWMLHYTIYFLGGIDEINACHWLDCVGRSLSNASKPGNRRGNPTKYHAMFIVPWPRSPSIGCAQRHRDAKLLPLHQLNVGSRPGWQRSKWCQIMSQQMDCSTTIKSVVNIYGPAFRGGPCPNSCTSTSRACWDHTMGAGTWSLHPYKI